MSLISPTPCTTELKHENTDFSTNFLCYILQENANDVHFMALALICRATIAVDGKTIRQKMLLFYMFLFLIAINKHSFMETLCLATRPPGDSINHSSTQPVICCAVQFKYEERPNLATRSVETVYYILSRF
jgi:hypothetical protein